MRRQRPSAAPHFTPDRPSFPPPSRKRSAVDSRPAEQTDKTCARAKALRTARRLQPRRRHPPRRPPSSPGSARPPAPPSPEFWPLGWRDRRQAPCCIALLRRGQPCAAAGDAAPGPPAVASAAGGPGVAPPARAASAPSTPTRQEADARPDPRPPPRLRRTRPPPRLRRPATTTARLPRARASAPLGCAYRRRSRWTPSPFCRMTPPSTRLPPNCAASSSRRRA